MADATTTTTPLPPWLQALLDQFGEQNPQALYSQQFGGLAGPNTPLGRYIQGRQSDTFNSYMGQLLSNPALTYKDYLGTINPAQEFSNLAPRQRGENPGQFSPRVVFGPPSGQRSSSQSAF